MKVRFLKLISFSFLILALILPLDNEVNAESVYQGKIGGNNVFIISSI